MVSISFISLSILVSTFLLSHILHITPCFMCVIERYPYAAAAILGLSGAWLPEKHTLHKTILWLLGATFFISVSLSFYHVGLEYNFFELPTFCGGKSPTHFETVTALKQYLIEQKQIVRCDIPPLRVFGFSMAEINFFISILLLGFVLYFIRKRNDS